MYATYGKCEKCGETAMLRYTNQNVRLCHECRHGLSYRQCVECGTDISRRDKRAKLCHRCAAEKQRLAKQLNMQRKRLKKVPLKRFATKGIEKVPDSAIEIIDRIRAGERYTI